MKRWEIPEPDPKYTNLKQHNKLRVKDAEVWTKEILKHVPVVHFHALLDDRDHQLTVTNYLCYQNILCMPVVASPWIAVLMHPNPANSYDNAFTVLYNLLFLRLFVRDCAFKTGSQEANRIHSLSAELDNELKLETAALDKTLTDTVYSPYTDKKINDTNAVFKFIKQLEKYTLRFINLLECFLWKALVEPRKCMPLENCLSPHAILNAKCLFGKNNDIEQWKICIQTNAHYFRLRNALYKAATGRESENLDYFGHETIPRDVFQAMREGGGGDNSKNYIYNSYLLGSTAKKYFDMLNIHFS